MIGKAEYEEPRCVLCMHGDERDGSLPRRAAERLDAFYARDDLDGAEKFALGRLEESVCSGDEALEFFLRNELIGIYRKAGQKENALGHADKAVELAQKMGIASRADGAYAFINAATAYKAFGYPEVALMLFETVKDICESELGSAYALGSFYNNMALTLCDLGRFAEARGYYEKALRVMQSEPGGEAEQAITYLNLADLSVAEKGFEEAKGETEALAIQAKALLESPKLARGHDYAFVCAKCAPSFEFYGMKDYARVLEERSRSIYERN